MSKSVSLWLVAILIVLAIAEGLFAHHHHPEFVWHHWPGFLGAVGLVSCLIVVKFSKTILKKLIQRPEDYDA